MLGHLESLDLFSPSVHVRRFVQGCLKRGDLQHQKSERYPQSLATSLPGSVL